MHIQMYSWPLILLVRMLVEWFVFAACLQFISGLIPDVQVKNFASALIAAVVIVFVDLTLGRVLRFLSFPINFITLGLFSLVIFAVVLKVASLFTPGFKIKGFLPAVWAALVIAILRTIAYIIFRW